MSAEWSYLAPVPEGASNLDEVQQGLTAGQTFSGGAVETARHAMLLAPARHHDEDPGRRANYCAVIGSRDKGNSGTQGQARAKQAATEHRPIRREGIGRE